MNEMIDDDHGSGILKNDLDVCLALQDKIMDRNDWSCCEIVPNHDHLNDDVIGANHDEQISCQMDIQN